MPAAPKVSDLGPVWAEVFWGSYVRDSLRVEYSFSIPRPFAAPVEPEARWSNGDSFGEGEHFFEFLDGSGDGLESVPIRFELGGAYFLEGEREPHGAISHMWHVGVVDPPDYAGYRIVATRRLLEYPAYMLPLPVQIEEDARPDTAPAGDSGSSCRPRR